MKSGVCAIARYENDYLLEWMTYHLQLGFDYIFLYDNNNPGDDAVPIIVSDNKLADKVRVIDYRGRRTCQIEAYNECLMSFGMEVDWIAFIDLDEFLTFNKEQSIRTINEFLSNVKDFNSVLVNWMCYGDSGLVYKDERKVTERFITPISLDSPINKHVKSIVKTKQGLFYSADPHRVQGEVKPCDDCLKEAPIGSPFKNPSFQVLYIRHYNTKTIEEYIKSRMFRGAADQISSPYATLDRFYDSNERTPEKETLATELLQLHKNMEYNVTVSVIVPNYNHKKYLKQRLDSILNQTFDDFELILLDDCSSDGSQELLLSYQDNSHVTHIVINERNSGSPFLQWEKGLNLARGEYVWLAESDDYSAPTFLERTVMELQKNPKASICYTGSYCVNGDGLIINAMNPDVWEEDDRVYTFTNSVQYSISYMLNVNTVYNASMVVFKRKDCLSNITPEFRTMRYCGDWLFWINQIGKGEVIEIHRKLNYFRKHDSNTTDRGVDNGNSIFDVAVIKNLFYTQFPLSCKERLVNKADFYRHVKYFPVSPRRRKELFRMIAQRAHVTRISYIIGRRLIKYLCKFIK
jgi:glycosyltransferase involved in cell wall biosynthesis